MNKKRISNLPIKLVEIMYYEALQIRKYISKNPIQVVENMFITKHLK